MGTLRTRTILGTAIAAAAALPLAAQSPDIQPAPSPSFIHVDLTPHDIVSSTDESWRYTAEALGAQMLTRRGRLPDATIAVNMRGAPISYDFLTRQERSNLEPSFPPDVPRTRGEMRAYYEGRISELLTTSLSHADGQDPDGRYGVYGLPVETVNGSYDLGAACNERYATTIDLVEAFVSSRSFILYSSNSTEWDTVRQGLQEAVRLRRDDQVLMFRTNGNWRVAFDPDGQNGVPTNPDIGDGTPVQTTTLTAQEIDAGRMMSIDEMRERRDRHNDPPPGNDPSDLDFSFQWSVTGDYASSVNIDAYPIERDTVIFYAYMLGMVPRIVNDEVFHGGAPQLGDLEAHLARIESDLNSYVPDPEWDGYAVIDYEAWPTYWEGAYPEVQEISREHVRRNHPGYTRQEVEARAKAEFEAGAREFLLATIQRCRELRPNAKWGYFIWQRYFADYAPPLSSLMWLWDASDALYPSVYPTRFSVDGPPTNQWQARWDHYEQKFADRVFALRQLVGPDKPIFAYIQRKYMDWNQRYGGQSINDIDIDMAIYAPLRTGADGAMIWETLDDQETADIFQEYLDSEMGPRMIDLIDGLD